MSFFLGKCGYFFKNVCHWPTFIEICLSITNIFAANVGQWGWFLQKWRTTIICTVSHLYEFFSWKVWLFHWFCVLTGWAVPCSAISCRLISLTPLTNISWKMSVNDQHFLKNVCQWPTFIEICLSVTNIFAANVGQWGWFLQKWRTTIICTVSHLYECFSWKVWLFHWSAFSPVARCPVTP